MVMNSPITQKHLIDLKNYFIPNVQLESTRALIAKIASILKFSLVKMSQPVPIVIKKYVRTCLNLNNTSTYTYTRAISSSTRSRLTYAW